MLPPPKPWTQVGAADPDREYVAFTSRCFLKSPLRLPKWMAQGPPIMKQVDAAPGIVGWSLGMLDFSTLSAWEDAASLRAFTQGGAHAETLEQFERAMRRDSIFVECTVFGRDLPLGRGDAVTRQNASRER
jgi:hypothetical protein